MKTPDEIKKLLANHKSYTFNAETLFTEALAYIQQLEAAAPKWISMEERLPEISDLVLVIANGKPKENIELINAELIASYWGDEGWIADGYDGWDKLKVSHWMPLPEPPKEEGEKRGEEREDGNYRS